MTAPVLVEDAEEAKEDVSKAIDEAMGDGTEEGRKTPEVVMTDAVPFPVKESPTPKNKDEKTVVPKIR